MIESFAPYSATLRVDPLWRRVVVGSGAIFGVAGFVVVGRLPIGIGWAGLLALAWGAMFAAELLILVRAYRTCIAVTVHADGSVEIERSDGLHDSGRLLPGSVILHRWAWLRMRLPAAPAWAEPFAPGKQDREQWRRFQVICRHLTTC